MQLRVVFLAIISFFYCACSTYGQSSSPLFLAIKKNDQRAVDSLLRAGIPTTIVDDDSDNVLMYAALYSTTGCMNELLKHGADVNLKNKLQETALIWSLHDIGKVRLLLAHGADINAKTTTGNTALISASVGASQQDMIRLLLENNADPLVKNKRGINALMQNSLYGDTTIARMLLKAGVDINAITSEKETALFWAVKSLNKPMIKWLVENGADVNTLDSYKANALSYAVVLNDTEIVALLLDKTQDLNLQDIDGMSLLMWATYNENDNPAIIQMLLDHGSDTKLKDKGGRTALTWALKKGNTATVALLKKSGATQ